MLLISKKEPLTNAVEYAIRSGDIQKLKQLLHDHPGLAKARLMNEAKHNGASRTLLHVVTDWPGHFQHGAASVSILIAAGADVNTRFHGPHGETPLHWAASSDDIEVLDALIDSGADIEASGAVIAGGTPLDDAVAFGQWRAAHRLVERGTKFALWHAAALGLMDPIEAYFAGTSLSERYPWGANSTSPPDHVTVAFWCACHGGQWKPAAYLLNQGAELNWISVWDGLTPLDAAQRSSAKELVQWLCAQGAKTAKEMNE